MKFCLKERLVVIVMRWNSLRDEILPKATPFGDSYASMQLKVLCPPRGTTPFRSPMGYMKFKKKKRWTYAKIFGIFLFVFEFTGTPTPFWTYETFRVTVCCKFATLGAIFPGKETGRIRPANGRPNWGGFWCPMVFPAVYFGFRSTTYSSEPLTVILFENVPGPPKTGFHGLPGKYCFFGKRKSL